MPELLEDCPRCGAQRTTFDVKSLNVRKSDHQSLQPVIETFTVCRACGRSTVFNLQPRTVDATALFVQRPAELANKNVNSLVRVNGYVNIGDVGATPAPAHLPDEVRQSFEEGAKCHALNCPNAAGAMLRLCLDLASKQMLTIVPAAAQQPNAQQRKDLAPRLNWLIDNHYLPRDLHDLVHCIRDDGNVAAHQGTVTAHESEEMMDLTLQVLNRVYTEPGNLAAIKARQAARKTAKT